jgi:hypothetical protein
LKNDVENSRAELDREQSTNRQLRVPSLIVKRVLM